MANFPWIDFLGLFLFLAGFIIGLGAVTVIDFHGLFGRKSAYWTEAATRTHKITKPLIWLGLILAAIGGTITYRHLGWNGPAVIHFFIALMIAMNGLYLSFFISPFLLKREKEGKAAELLPKSFQNKIIISFIVSLLGWWGALVVLVKYLILR